MGRYWPVVGTLLFGVSFVLCVACWNGADERLMYVAGPLAIAGWVVLMLKWDAYSG